MSLDVHLIIENKPGTVGTDKIDEKIFIRRDGATVEISFEEWHELHPNRKPVTLISNDNNDNEVYWANITHNMGKMARECGLEQSLWRPEELGITHARQLIELLRIGLGKLKDHPDYYQQFNPENGWGNYELLVQFVEGYLAACEKNPNATVKVSR